MNKDSTDYGKSELQRKNSKPKHKPEISASDYEWIRRVWLSQITGVDYYCRDPRYYE